MKLTHISLLTKNTLNSLHFKSYNETVPPRWIVEPTDMSVERNRHITLHCQAQGVPTPTVVWKKATGKNNNFINLQYTIS